MKSLIITLLIWPALALSHSFAEEQVWASQSQSAQNFISLYSQSVAQSLPEQIKNSPIHDIYMNHERIQLRINRVNFVIEKIQGPELKLKLNGQIFSAKELASPQLARKNIIDRFGIQMREVSILSLLLSQAWANTPVDPTGSSNSGGVHSFNFLPMGNMMPIGPRFSSLAALREFLEENDVNEALGIASHLMTAISQFALNDSAFTQIFNFGATGPMPTAPNFSTSPRAVR
jgi:hypothetical protein